MPWDLYAPLWLWPLSLAGHVLVIVRLPFPASRDSWGAHGLTWAQGSALVDDCLSVQELQCDVSVEEDSRQEWTFTLYDFDNNGKVTREVGVLAATRQPSGTGAGLSLSLPPPPLPAGAGAVERLEKGCWEHPEGCAGTSGWGGGTMSIAKHLTQSRVGGRVPFWGEVGDSGKVQGLPREGPQVPTVYPYFLLLVVPKR